MRIPTKTPVHADPAPRPVAGARARDACFRIVTGPPRPIGTSIASTFTASEGAVIVDAASGARLRLGRKLGEGGEGAVFAVGDDLVCKTYDRARLTSGLREKLTLMIENRVEHPALCWPRTLALSLEGHLVGYLMPRAQGRELQKSIFIKPLLQSTFPDWTRLNLVTLAISVLEPIRLLHDRNVIVGDINPLNILVADDREVHFVDCDSYQVEDFGCPVGTATFLAPDLIGCNLSQTLRTISHELFAVATLVFMILVPGKPPYSHAGGGDPATNVRKRHFPYALAEKRGAGVPDGPWRYIWSHLPFYLKEAFHDVFTDGSRLATAEWLELLRRYDHDLRRGHVANQIFPTSFKELRRDEVLRRGGKWIKCQVCGANFGTFDDSHTACRACAQRRVDVRCFLCAAELAVTATQVRRLDGKEPICPGCHAHTLERWCRECRSSFSMSAANRAYFKRKGLSLPTRCKPCRARRRGSLQSSNAATDSEESAPQVSAQGQPGRSHPVGFRAQLQRLIDNY